MIGYSYRIWQNIRGGNFRGILALAQKFSVYVLQPVVLIHYNDGTYS